MVYCRAPMAGHTLRGSLHRPPQLQGHSTRRFVLSEAKESQLGPLRLNQRLPSAGLTEWVFGLGWSQEGHL